MSICERARPGRRGGNRRWSRSVIAVGHRRSRDPRERVTGPPRRGCAPAGWRASANISWSMQPSLQPDSADLPSSSQTDGYSMELDTWPELPKLDARNPAGHPFRVWQNQEVRGRGLTGLATANSHRSSSSRQGGPHARLVARLGLRAAMPRT